MVDPLEQVILIATGAAMMWFADWMVRFWTQHKQMQDQADAEKVLSAHGLSAYSYMPAIGIEDPELHEALERSVLYGRIILDDQGRVIGKVLPKVAKRTDNAQLRLVVDNS